MTLTTNGKNWIAQNLGINNCMTETSRTFTYHDDQNNVDISDTGGTAIILNRLVDSLCSYVTIAGTKYQASALSTANGSMPAYPTDVQWVMANDSGASQYCVGTTPPPGCTEGDAKCEGGNAKNCNASGTWITSFCGANMHCEIVGGVAKCVVDTTPSEGDLRCDGAYVQKYTNGSWVTQSPVCEFGCTNGYCNADPGGDPGSMTNTGPFGITIKEGTPCPPGAPTVILDTSKARPYFKTSPVTYVGIMGIDVTNVNTGNNCYGHFAWEVRMWAGTAGTTCPTSTPVLRDISRFLAKVSDHKSIGITTLGTNETDDIGASVEIPTFYKGEYTICMSLWGNHDRQALLDELFSERGYEEDVVWA